MVKYLTLFYFVFVSRISSDLCFEPAFLPLMWVLGVCLDSQMSYSKPIQTTLFSNSQKQRCSQSSGMRCFSWPWTHSGIQNFVILLSWALKPLLWFISGLREFLNNSLVLTHMQSWIIFFLVTCVCQFLSILWIHNDYKEFSTGFIFHNRMSMDSI